MRRKIENALFWIAEKLMYTAAGLVLLGAVILVAAFILLLLFSPFIGIGALMYLAKYLFFPQGVH